MADQVNITTQAGSGAVVNSSVSSSGAISTSVRSGTNAQSTVSGDTSFNTTTTGASGPQGEPGADGVFSVIASQVEAEAGTDNVKGMTPLRVKQAIDTLATGEANNISDVNATDLTDGGDTTIHYHSADRARANHTGTQTASTISDFDTEVANNSAVTANTAKISFDSASSTKLAGIATGATANSSDATLLDRTNHTGSQAISTVTDLQTTLDAKVVGPVSATDNAIPRFDGTTGKIVQDSGYTIDDSGTLLTTGLINSSTIVAAPTVATASLEEYVLDAGLAVEGVTMKDGLVDGRDVSVDGAKLDGVASGATANSSDATLLARANHTGTQSADTITDGTTNKAYTATEKTKLAGIASGAEVNTVDSVNGATGAVVLDAEDVLPTQTGNNGKYLTTNGTVSSWGTLAGGGDMSASTYDPATISEQLVGLTATQTLTNKTLTSPVVNTPTGIVKGDVGLGNVDNTSDATLTSSILNTIYPVGILVELTVSTNPGTLFGIGTWTAHSTGRVTVSKAVSGTFGTAGATGGVEEVTLTAAQSGLPAHNHSITDPGHTHEDNTYAKSGSNGSQPEGTPGALFGGHSTGSNTTGITINNNTAADASSAHTNLQPYVVVYRWERTA